MIGSSSGGDPARRRRAAVDGRLCESLVGDVVTDAMRTKYASIGVEFAITNSGGLRDRPDVPDRRRRGTDFCPAFTPPPYPITRGQVLAVLPFGNIVVTLTVNGAELKTMLENGVSSMPARERALPAGLWPLLHLQHRGGRPAAGSPARSARPPTARAPAPPIDLTAASTYKIAENDFMASGGDGYPNFISRVATQDIMDQVLADYVTANSPLNPFVLGPANGRINCANSNGTTAPNCPTLITSP